MIRYTWLSTSVDLIWPLGKEWDSQEEHNTHNITNHQCRLTAGYSYTKPESPNTDDPKPGTPHYLNLDYELHQGTKLDYLFIESSKLLEGSEIQLLKNLCEQERTQKMTILMISMENPRLAGYMLTGTAPYSSVPMAASLG